MSRAVKRARPPLPLNALADPEAYLTTVDAARLLRVHPKHIYRLLRRGLPGHRVGGEWRFFSEEILRWSGAKPPPPTALRSPWGNAPADAIALDPAPLVAANGDIAVERLLSRVKGDDGPWLGFVQADRSEGLGLLRRGTVLAAGYHGPEIPAAADGHRLAFIHLVHREVGLAVRRGVRFRGLRQLGRLRLASRPETAGIRVHFDGEARRQGLDPLALHANSVLLPSHREVACAVARGEADVGLASVAWAHHVGLDCARLGTEAYGLLVRASLLGHPWIVRLCEVAQSAWFQADLKGVMGYDAQDSGVISYRANTKGAS